jgi:hypothetical protein
MAGCHEVAPPGSLTVLEAATAVQTYGSSTKGAWRLHISSRGRVQES